MDSRERVMAAVKFERPDRIPVDLWTVPAVYLRHGRAVDGLLHQHPTDFARRDWDPEGMDGRLRAGRYVDEWGCLWENKAEGYFGMVAKLPLEDYRALDSLRPPFEWMEDDVRKGTSEHPQPGKFWLGWGGDFFHRMCWLRGMEKVMFDLMDGSPELYRLREMLLDFFARQVTLVSKTDVDGICFADDFGSQQQLLIPPSLWRSFIKPVYRDILGICKSAGKLVFFHSDGNILEIMDDLIELGVDALNCQVWCMGGPEVLGKRFAGKLTFWGELDRQSTIPHGTPDDIFRAARRMKEHLGLETGGLIGQGEVDGLTPLENIEAILTAWN